MAVRRILKFPDPALRAPTRSVGNPALHRDLPRLIADMTDTMYAANGAGLAAIQIGDLRKVFIIDATVAGGREGDPPHVFIDPGITELSPETDRLEEGCLSFPGVYRHVMRSRYITINATGIDGQRFDLTAAGFYAQALQHECDHLEGRLLIDVAERKALQ